MPSKDALAALLSCIYLSMPCFPPDDFRCHVLNGATERVRSFLL